MLGIATKSMWLKNRVCPRHEGSTEKLTQVASATAWAGKLGPGGQIQPTACLYK